MSVRELREDMLMLSRYMLSIDPENVRIRALVQAIHFSRWAVVSMLLRSMEEEYGALTYNKPEEEEVLTCYHGLLDRLHVIVEEVDYVG